MEDLSMNEAIQIAIMCARKGMPLEAITDMGINISTFPPEKQAEIHGMYAIKNIDENIQNTLYNAREER